MEVWVCRDEDGYYHLFPPDTDPWKACDGEWDLSEFGGSLGGPMCAEMFKEWSGLRRHLRKGTRRKMTWTKPLDNEEGR